MQSMTELLTLKHIEAAQGQLRLFYSVDTFSFETVIRYQDVDFAELRTRYGSHCIDTLIFHIAFFEGMKYCSLFPAIYDVSRYGALLHQETLELFVLVYCRVFAQHRWEHQFPGYSGPLIRGGTAKTREPVTVQGGTPDLLLSCGGGKDSLVTMKLLERAAIPYAASLYAHSVYGSQALQYNLIDGLLDCGLPYKRHCFAVEDDFLGGAILQDARFAGKITSLCAPETPCSIFESLPLALAHGYCFLCVGHERDSDSGNFYWEAAGEEVNHQWGKSYEAERALAQHIQRHLIDNFSYFSLLKPLHDLLIFRLLRQDQAYIEYTHSCNLVKPWCKRCPKCVYVWLCYVAYLDNQGEHENIFGANLFDEPEVAVIFLQLLGLEGHRPFECIGEVDSVRLACFFCVQKGMQGAILERFKREILPALPLASLLEKYNTIYRTEQGIPEVYNQRLWPLFEEARIL
jgi:hypothetical protein